MTCWHTCLSAQGHRSSHNRLDWNRLRASSQTNTAEQMISQQFYLLSPSLFPALPSAALSGSPAFRKQYWNTSIKTQKIYFKPLRSLLKHKIKKCIWIKYIFSGILSNDFSDSEYKSTKRGNYSILGRQSKCLAINHRPQIWLVNF